MNNETCQSLFPAARDSLILGELSECSGTTRRYGGGREIASSSSSPITMHP